MPIRRLAVLPAVPDRAERRWPDVRSLCCPVCRRGVRAQAPGYWRMVDGPVPSWSHRDARALCRIRTDDGIRVAEPVLRHKATHVRQARPPVPRRQVAQPPRPSG